mmetsp:Transcript_47111/g.117479  ORF Transcript_47111/g.117479 Transcript_47111/m.117479 type:complete len:286 (+) Transcript_47111:616-1473(+)
MNGWTTGRTVQTSPVTIHAFIVMTSMNGLNVPPLTNSLSIAVDLCRLLPSEEEAMEVALILNSRWIKTDAAVRSIHSCHAPHTHHTHIIQFKAAHAASHPLPKLSLQPGRPLSPTLPSIHPSADTHPFIHVHTSMHASAPPHWPGMTVVGVMGLGVYALLSHGRGRRVGRHGGSRSSPRGHGHHACRRHSHARHHHRHDGPHRGRHGRACSLGHRRRSGGGGGRTRRHRIAGGSPCPSRASDCGHGNGHDRTHRHRHCHDARRRPRAFGCAWRRAICVRVEPSSR